MTDCKETSWNHIQGESTGTFYTSEKRWITKILKWKEKFPDDVDIRHVNKDGSILVRLPVSYCKISPKIKRNMTDEDKEALRDRLAKSRQKTTVVL